MIKKLFKKKKTKIDEESLLNCPRDDTVMDKKVLKDVVIDICPTCKGIWLDDKEIDKLVDYAKEYGSDKK